MIKVRKLLMVGLVGLLGVAAFPVHGVSATPKKKANGRILFVGAGFVGGWPLYETPLYGVIDTTRETYVDIFSTDMEGEVHRLTDLGLGKYAQAPRVSADGEWVVFQRVQMNHPLSYSADLMLMRPDGSDQQVLMDTPNFEAGPDWSPRGNQIVFVDLTERDLRVLDLRTKMVQIVGSWGALPSEPAWSPDGKLIAFEMNDAIYVIRSNGKGLRRLTGKPHLKAGSADWSPDGRWIAFGRTRAAEPGAIGAPPDHLANDIWLVSRDGSKERQLTDSGGTEYEESPSWSPDGRYITYIQAYGDKGAWDVWIMKADGSENRRVFGFEEQLVISNQAYWPEWMPET